MSATEPELVTRQCDQCSFEATGPATGAGSVGFKLGTHKYREHGVRSTRRRGGKAAASRVSDDDVEARPVVSLVRDIADQVGGAGAPSADALTAGLGRGLGLVSVAVASFAAETDPMFPAGPDGDDARNALVSHLSLTDKAARDTMRPLGKAIAPTSFNRKHGRQIVDNVDVVASVAEIATLAMHWRTYFRHRSAYMAMIAAGGGPTPTWTVPAEETFGPTPQPASETVATSPAPVDGMVVDASMVAELRKRQGR